MNLPGAVLRLASRDPLRRRSPSSIPRSCCDEPPPTKSAAPQKYRTSEADVKGFKWRIATRRGDARRERFPFVLSIQDSPCPPFCVCQALSHVMMRSILLLLHAATNIRAASPLAFPVSLVSHHFPAKFNSLLGNNRTRARWQKCILKPQATVAKLRQRCRSEASFKQRWAKLTSRRRKLPVMGWMGATQRPTCPAPTPTLFRTFLQELKLRCWRP